MLADSHNGPLVMSKGTGQWKSPTSELVKFFNNQPANGMDPLVRLTYWIFRQSAGLRAVTVVHVATHLVVARSDARRG